MRENLELPTLAAKRRRLLLLAGLILSLFVCLANSGCKISSTVKVNVPPGILQAKTASFDELLQITKRCDDINSLSCNNLKVKYISGKIESGLFKKFRTAPGYALFKRADSTRLVIQNPVTKSAELDVASMGDDFSFWVPRENKLYMGKNSAKELVAEDSADGPGFTIRPTQIFSAVLPQSVQYESPGIRVLMREETDESAKYYVLIFVKEGSGFKLNPIREIWIERSGLTIARQESYLENGAVESIIRYSRYEQVGGHLFPHRIYIDRPGDGYTFEMECGAWRLDPDLQDNAFNLTPPPRAKRVHLKEKQRSDAS